VQVDRGEAKQLKGAQASLDHRAGLVRRWPGGPSPAPPIFSKGGPGAAALAGSQEAQGAYGNANDTAGLFTPGAALPWSPDQPIKNPRPFQLLNHGFKRPSATALAPRNINDRFDTAWAPSRAASGLPQQRRRLAPTQLSTRQLIPLRQRPRKAGRQATQQRAVAPGLLAPDELDIAGCIDEAAELTFHSHLDYAPLPRVTYTCVFRPRSVSRPGQVPFSNLFTAGRAGMASGLASESRWATAWPFPFPLPS